MQNQLLAETIQRRVGKSCRILSGPNGHGEPPPSMMKASIRHDRFPHPGPLPEGEGDQSCCDGHVNAPCQIRGCPHPCVVLIDAHMPQGDWEARLEDMREGCAQFFAALINVSEIREVEDVLYRHPEIRGVLPQSADLEQIVQAISCLSDGEHWLPRQWLAEHFETFRSRESSAPSPALNRLTDSERKILLQLAEGKSNTDIANFLFLSHNTVKTHIYNLYRKLGVSNRVQAVLWAQEHQAVLDGSSSSGKFSP